MDDELSREQAERIYAQAEAAGSAAIEDRRRRTLAWWTTMPPREGHTYFSIGLVLQMQLEIGLGS